MSAAAPKMAHLSSSAEDGRARVAPGVELAFIDRGRGQPIVLIPGWTFAKEIFEKQIAFLARSYRVITYDPRSHGHSSFSLDGNDYDSHAKDLAVLLKVLQVRNPILVGCSSGAHTAWAYIRMNGPGAVAANVVIDTPPKCLSHEPDRWVHGTLDQIAAVHTIYLRDAKGQGEFIRRHAETVLIQRNLYPEELDWIVAQSMSTQPLIAAQLYASFMFADHTAQAIAVAKARPTMFFIAQHWADKAVPFIKRLLPESRYVVFGGGMMFWEYPDAFNLVMEEFIKAHVTVAEDA